MRRSQTSSHPCLSFSLNFFMFSVGKMTFRSQKEIPSKLSLEAALHSLHTWVGRGSDPTSLHLQPQIGHRDICLADQRGKKCLKLGQFLILPATLQIFYMIPVFPTPSNYTMSGSSARCLATPPLALPNLIWCSHRKCRWDPTATWELLVHLHNLKWADVWWQRNT